jgi:hypothetical protein
VRGIEQLVRDTGVAETTRVLPHRHVLARPVMEPPPVVGAATPRVYDPIGRLNTDEKPRRPADLSAIGARPTTQLSSQSDS